MDNAIQELDAVEFLEDEMLEKASFWELSYYLQCLNQIDESFLNLSKNEEANHE